MSGRHPNFMFVRMARVIRLGCFCADATWSSVLSEFTVLALQLPILLGKVGRNFWEGSKNLGVLGRAETRHSCICPEGPGTSLYDLLWP